MDDEVVRITVGLRLGLPLCHPHLCFGCGAELGEDGIHGLSYRYSKGCHSRHAALNDIVKRSLDAAKVPSNLEPSGLYRSDGRMERQWCPGREGRYWCGTQHVLTL